MTEQPAADALIASVLGIPPERVTDGLAFQSIPEWDSLRHVDLILALEAECGVVVEPEQMVQLTTVESIRRQLGLE